METIVERRPVAGRPRSFTHERTGITVNGSCADMCKALVSAGVTGPADIRGLGGQRRGTIKSIEEVVAIRAQVARTDPLNLSKRHMPLPIPDRRKAA